MPEEPDATALLQRLCADQGDRWHRGERVRAETYLEQHPALAAEADRAVELVYNEMLLREELGETPRLGEYVERFPQFATQLGRLFEVHGALEPGGPLTSQPTVPSEVTLRPAAAATAGHLPAVAGYEILGELGRGGMGVVYRARHLSLRRVVALKMILSGAHAGPDELARFRAEAAAQARLQHPNIVQIYEIGEAAGRPYFALEYVDGGSLAQRLAGTPQPARPAAQLVETLARAVHYAHQRGLVHRDLKPGNVLLEAPGLQPGGLGTPKITDFGLAKRLEGGAGPTTTGAILGTPSYMAPEQASGRSADVGPATDVYALGAILYELLTGRPPFLAETPLETLAQVQSQEPVAPRRLQPKVPRDLNTICLKCLHKEARRRYASAEALADDLGRFLADRPIVARPVGRVGRLWRWCRRKPAVASLAAALLLGVAVGFPAVTYLWLAASANARKAEEQGRRAEQNLRDARQAVRKHFLDLSEIELSKEPGTHEVQKKLLEDALAYFRDFLRQRPDDPALLADVAEAHARLGKITAKIGTKEDALAEFQQARELYEQLVRGNPADAGFRSMLAETCHNIGAAERERGHRAEALRYHEQARAIREKLVEADPNALQPRRELANTCHNIGLLEHEDGHRAEALRCYERARAIREELVAANPVDERFQFDLAMSYNNIGVLLRQGGNYAEALRCHEQARIIQEKLAAANPANAEFQRYLAGSYVNLGLVCQKTGQPSEALRCYEQARVVQEKVVVANPSVSQFQSDLAQSYNYLGNLRRERSQPAEALRCYEQARAVHEKLVQANPTVIEYQAALAASHHNLGRTHQENGERAEALRCYEEARGIQEKLVTANPNVASFLNELALTHNNLGRVHQEGGRRAEALGCYEKARAIREKLVAANPNVPQFQSELAASYNNIGTLHDMAKEPIEALRAYEQARSILEKLVAANPTVPQFQLVLAQIHFNIGGNLQSENGRLADALHSFEKTSVLCEKLVNDDPSQIEYRKYACEAAHWCGEALRQMDRRREALAAYQRAIEHRRLLLNKVPRSAPYHYEMARELASCVALVGTGKAERTAQEEAERRRYADRAVEALRQAVASGFKNLKELREGAELDVLRSRDDFKKLLAELEEKVKPAAK